MMISPRHFLALAVVAATGCAPSVTLRPLAPNVWLHVTTSKDGIAANGLLVAGAKDSVLVDSGWNDREAEKLFALAARVAKPVGAVIVTHWHGDRIGGAAFALRRGVKVYALQKTIAHAKAEGKPIPDTPVRDGDSVGDVTIVFAGAGHTDDNIAVWVPSAKVLYGGCLVRSATASDLGYFKEADLQAWPRTIAALQQRFPDAQIVVPGHDDVGGDALAHTIELLRAHAGATTTAVP